MIISVKDLSFSYMKQRQLFEELEWTVPAGAVVGLLGSNGAGKSSLLRLLSGLLFPKSGTIAIGPYRPKERQVEFLEQIFLLTDDVSHAIDLSIAGYEKLMGAFYPSYDSAQFAQILIDFGLDKKAKLKDLSLGERKKAFLSFALSTNCRWLFFDEPTNGLDIPSKSVFRKIVAGNLKEDQTLIIAIRLVADVEKLIDRVAILNNGRIQLDADLLELSDQLLFSTASSRPDNAMYMEKVGTGYHFIRPREEHDAQTPVNLELLFNAVLSSSRDTHSILKTKNSEVL
jgi:ABC-2 type transport system ATP-binding protein